MVRLDTTPPGRREFARWAAGFTSIIVISASVAATRAAADPFLAAPFLSYDAGTKPNSVAIGDLNGDGIPDLAAANSGGSTVSVLLGNGNGTFGATTDFGTGSGPPEPVNDFETPASRDY